MTHSPSCRPAGSPRSIPCRPAATTSTFAVHCDHAHAPAGDELCAVLGARVVHARAGSARRPAPCPRRRAARSGTPDPPGRSRCSMLTLPLDCSLAIAANIFEMTQTVTSPAPPAAGSASEGETPLCRTSARPTRPNIMQNALTPWSESTRKPASESAWSPPPPPRSPSWSRADAHELQQRPHDEHAAAEQSAPEKNRIDHRLLAPVSLRDYSGDTQL